MARFQKGRSGNPAGKPKGARHRATLAAEALLDGEAERLTRKAIELALAGDVVALKLALDRILPARKGRPVHFSMPPVRGVADLIAFTSRLTAAAASGDLTPSEAGELAKLFDTHIKAIETVDFERRLRSLESREPVDETR